MDILDIDEETAKAEKQYKKDMQESMVNLIKLLYTTLDSKYLWGITGMFIKRGYPTREYHDIVDIVEQVCDIAKLGGWPINVFIGTVINKLKERTEIKRGF